MLNKVHLQVRPGFTLSEAVVVIVVISFIITGVMAIAFNYFGSTSEGRAKAQLTNESQNFLRTLSENIRTGSGVAAINTIDDPNHGEWNTSVADNVLILRVPVRDSAREFIVNSETGYPYQNEVVIFADGDHLYQRMLAHPDPVDNRSSTTCPNAAASTSCSADTVLSQNFRDLNFKMYDQDNAETTVHTNAKSLSLNLTLSEHTAGGNVTTTNIARLTFRNNTN